MRKLALTIACALLAAPAAFAAQHVDVSSLVKPGLYQITGTVTMPGMPPMGPRTTTSCVTRDDTQHFAEHAAAQLKKSKSKMHIEHMALHGKHLQFDMVGPDATMHFNIVFDNPTHYHQTITWTVEGQHMSAHGKGHRIGACPAKKSG